MLHDTKQKWGPVEVKSSAVAVSLLFIVTSEQTPSLTCRLGVNVTRNAADGPSFECTTVYCVLRVERDGRTWDKFSWSENRGPRA
jgi:hypothetical protein